MRFKQFLGINNWVYCKEFMKINVGKTIDLVNRFMPPEIMLQGLATSANFPCNCGDRQESGVQVQQQQLQMEIKELQSQILNIRNEISEADNLLQRRDSLYEQLDLLRDERQNIEAQIESSSIVQQTETVNITGYHQMNQRLRRRIYEVREYIQRMSIQNQKIEEGVIISNQHVSQQEEISFRRNRILQAQIPNYEGNRYNPVEFQSMIDKLHHRQDQAWRRVRTQEEEIERRNYQTRSRLGQTNYLGSPPVRSYYSPPQRDTY